MKKNKIYVTDIYELNKISFESLINSINRCYSVEYQNKLPNPSDFPKSIFNSNNDLIIKNLIDFAKLKNDIYLISVSKRIKAIKILQNSRDNNITLDLKLVWKLVSESILEIPSECTISSIGSQGFLSIPLFKYDKNMNDFDFIRLHIWDNSLSKYINSGVCENFAIHSHSFFVKSWIITGKIVNESYSVRETFEKTNFSIFKIEYNKTLNEVNQHTSSAVNTNTFVDLKKISTDEYITKQTYEIDEGKYHKAISLGENGLSATFFCFKTKNNSIVQSNVTGPSKIDSSEINRKMHINPNDLIKLIESKLN